MDTTSSAITRFLYLLSTHQDVQSKLRQEIVEARDRYGNLDYDELLALPYLDAICRETLRLWVLSFYCSVNAFIYKLPRSYPPVPYVQRTYVNLIILIISLINEVNLN